jgi:hypothetical protein
MSTTTLLDPTGERSPATRQRLPRPASLEGLKVALLDISKARGDVFLDRLEVLLNERHIATERFRKPTFAKPAPAALRQEIRSRCQVVIEALAD